MSRFPVGDSLLYQIGRFLYFGPLVDNLGMSRIKVAYTAGEAIGPEIFEFYRSLGINLKQLYGMTESCAYVSMQKDGEIDSESVGPPAPGVEIKISDKGEVLYKSPGNFLGYFKNPEATAETVKDGWLLSGDAGYMTEQGHLKIIDRAKDVSKLNDGTMFAPKYIENKLKFSPYIKGGRGPWDGQRLCGRFHRHRLRGSGKLGRKKTYRLYKLYRPRPETSHI